MDLHRALEQHFGFDRFRPGQEQAARAALAGRDTLVVMPTGAGKSLCYQLPALMRPDLTLVVSPLVSLMADQVQALERVAGGRSPVAALLNAQQDARANDAALRAAVAGELRMLYVAPERLAAPSVVRALARAKIGLFVVDEAHCVSQWGHDFRPDYFRLADAARWLKADAIIASTATATPAVAADIVERLQLREPVRVATGFDRPNLAFGVVPCASKAVRHRRLVAALDEPGATPAIVYAGTRLGCDTIADDLTRALGRPVDAYHAGLARDDRAAVQQRFMSGRTDVVVATNAFGMGVDKADVRTVVHATVPPSLEAYYQEAGRAGRDGAPARALLLAAPQDQGLHVFFVEQAQVPDALLQDLAGRVVAAAVDGRYELPLASLSGRADAARLKAIVGALAQVGVLQPVPAPIDRVRGRLLAPLDAAALAAARELMAAAEAARWAQYRAIWAFAEGSRCRRQALLDHFGDDRPPAAAAGACCDVCDRGVVPAAVRAAGDAPPPGAGRASRGPGRSGTAARPRAAPAAGPELDAAIMGVVTTAQPPVGRTRAVEILRGGRSAAIRRHSYDGLPAYGTYGHLSDADVLGRVDALLAAGALAAGGGMYPKLHAEPLALRARVRPGDLAQGARSPGSVARP
ncbi:hypothetical protein DSM112329_00276 [Paraconexibacter sp. AEG42_29]|uniref:ATP-dependent DNA helicase RecQ n=1 Tax=Paraconexibacter sp. AEG42_29 TaxID=2997339 RepID=A0AAU7APD7_9ACTN